jgi:hypothetical protein
MADYSENTDRKNSGYPVNAKATSNLVKRVEPLTTAKQVRSRFLKGINLKFPNGDEITDEDIKDKIQLAINNIELEIKIPVVAEQFQDRVAFDKDRYKSFIHVKTTKKPIISVEDFRVETTDAQNIFKIPSQWIDPGQFFRGQINVIPFLATYTGNFVAGYAGNAGLILLASMGGIHWIPSYWTVTYTAGLCKELGQVPLPVNYLIGIEAALMVLSMIGPTKEFNSVSLGQDGLSQSSSGPGNMLYAKRMEDLEKEKETLIRKITGSFGTKWFISDF